MQNNIGFDLDSLLQYIESELDGNGSVELSPVETGRSNETIIVTQGTSQFVLRKPPEGASSQAAHDVLREFEIMKALQETPVPVPQTVLSCDDSSIIGTEFYLMEYLEGHVIRGEEPDGFQSEKYRDAFSKTVIDTLATIHRVDVSQVGLSELGQPRGFTKRQVERWGKQLSWAFNRTGRREELSRLEEVGKWLEQNVPASTPQALTHGDYKIDNVMFDQNPPPKIIGVLDWEMGTYGDPLTDLGWLLNNWLDPEDPKPIFPTVTPKFLQMDGYATKRELVNRYEQQSGIEFTNERFYRALAAYKEAAACEVFYARYLEGTENPFFEQMDEAVPKIASRANEIVFDDEFE